MNKRDTERVESLLAAALAYLESDDETPIEPEIVRDHIDQALEILRASASETPTP